MKMPIWEPSEERIKKANMTRFIDFVNKRYGQKIDSYNELHEWPINNLSDFWASMWGAGQHHLSFWRSGKNARKGGCVTNHMNECIILTLVR